MKNTVVWDLRSILEEPIASVFRVDDIGNVLYGLTKEIFVSRVMMIHNSGQRNYKCRYSVNTFCGMVYEGCCYTTKFNSRLDSACGRACATMNGHWRNVIRSSWPCSKKMRSSR